MATRDAVAAAHKRLKHGKPPPPRNTLRSLTLDEIEVNTELFQVRSEQAYASSAHVAELASVPRRGKPLSPVIVWWNGEGWTCIDGHHRLEAYRVAKHPLGKAIHSRDYIGTLVQALMMAGQCNSQDKLPMTKTEKTQAAWAFIASTAKDSATVAAIERAFNVSERMIQYMRSAKEKLMVQDAEHDPSDLLWRNVRGTLAAGEGKPEKDWVAWTADEADRLEVDFPYFSRHLIMSKQNWSKSNEKCPLYSRIQG